MGAIFSIHPLQVGQDLAGRSQKLALVLELGAAAGERLVLDLHPLHAELGFANIAERLLDLRRRKLLEVVEQVLFNDPGFVGQLADPFERCLQVARLLLGRLELGLDRLQASRDRLVNQHEWIESLIRGLDRTHIGLGRTAPAPGWSPRLAAP